MLFRSETRFPELQSSLLAAIEIQPDFHTGRVSYLQDRVIGQVLAHAYQSPWERIVGWRALCGAHIVHWLLFSLLLVALWQVELATRRRPPVAQAAEVGAVAASPARFEVRIEPGDTEVERGTSLLVLARFTGELPPEATLIARVPGQDEVHVPMAKALEDPLFGGSVPNVKEPLEYLVEYAGQRSQPFQVAVFEFPRLVRADAQLRFPA